MCTLDSRTAHKTATNDVYACVQDRRYLVERRMGGGGARTKVESSPGVDVFYYRRFLRREQALEWRGRCAGVILYLFFKRNLWYNILA